MSIFWIEWRRCVNDDGDEDHVDEDLGDEVSAMQRRADDDASLEGVPRDDGCRCRVVLKKTMKNCTLSTPAWRVDGACRDRFS